MRPRAVPLVLPPCRVKKSIWKEGKTNLSHDGLNPAHVPLLQVNNLTLSAFCNGMMRRADIEGSKSYVALDAWQPQASYPCGNFSDTSRPRFWAHKGSIGQSFLVCSHTERLNQAGFCPLALREISLLTEPALVHLRYFFADVPPQSNSPPAFVGRLDRTWMCLIRIPAEAISMLRPK